jgi:hypothetical protein
MRRCFWHFLAMAALSSCAATGSDLDAARRTLTALDAGQDAASEELEGIDLHGYQSHYEVTLGGSVVLIAVIAHQGGGLIAFSGASGELVDAIAAPRIASVLLKDLDEDGTSEVIAEQVDAFGTGVQWRNFHLYSLRQSQWEQLWSGVSYSLETALMDGSGEVKIEAETSGYIRVIGPEGGHRARLIHVVFDALANTYTQSTFELFDGSLRATDLPFFSVR